MSKVQVYGPLADRFRAIIGCPIDYSDMIGKPIRDENGRVIGIVESVDTETDMWYGTIFDHNDILKMVEEEYRSMGI